MPLTRYGLREWLVITIVALLLGAGAIVVWPWALIPIVILWLALASFFRDPIRRLPAGLDDGAMISPADGVISAIEFLDEHEATDGPAVIIRIFLSVLNVHVNRAPCDVTVTALTYRPGKFLNAQTAESARVNESNLISLCRPGGERMGLRQVSGMIARRIVCAAKIGDTLLRGEKFGMIKFGSTTELILPRPGDVDVLVGPGDSVRGGRTVLAVLAPQAAAAAAGEPVAEDAAVRAGRN